MNIGAITGVNTFGGNSETQTDFNTSGASNSIFDNDKSGSESATGYELIDKMQKFFEKLETMEYDPRKPMFPGF